jgi:hypothetical protein
MVNKSPTSKREDLGEPQRGADGMEQPQQEKDPFSLKGQ